MPNISSLERTSTARLSSWAVRNIVFPIRVRRERFNKGELLDRWKQDVAFKITQLQNGTRWAQRRNVLRDSLMNNPLIERAYQNEKLQYAWKYLRWELWHSIEVRRDLKNRLFIWILNSMLT